MDQSSKLKKFEVAILEEITAKAELIEHEAEEFKKSELEKNNDVLLLKSYNEIQKKSQDIKKALKREVAKFGLDAKKSVLIKRNEITKAVFDNVTAKLFDFYTSCDYDEYIVKKLQSFSKANNLSDVIIYVGEKDFLNASKLSEAYALPCSFAEDKSIKLGGFIVKDTKDGIYFDETLATILTEQKEYFIQNSKLFL